MSGVASDNN